MTHHVTIRHNFETAHRLPHIGGKCRNLHGHSWLVTITIAAPTLQPDETLVEFSALKHTARAWIDQQLDHGTMLGHQDPLVTPLEQEGSKVFVIGRDWPHASWPTVETVAWMLADHAHEWLLKTTTPDDTYVHHVRVEETSVNTAEWTQP